MFLNDDMEKSIIKTDEDANMLMDAIIERTKSYLNSEADVRVLDILEIKSSNKKYDLNNITSIISIEDIFKISVIFSFEDKLIYKIFEELTKDFYVSKEEEEMYIEESAEDVINTIIGNILYLFKDNSNMYKLSIPLIINGAKSITERKNTNFYCTKLKTNYGEMLVFCIFPSKEYLEDFTNIYNN